MLLVLATTCLAVCSVVLAPFSAEAGTILIPAWSFARGNGRIHADPGKYADAGAVVGGGERKPWGWTLEYDVDFPITASYTLYVKYASAEARPVEVFFDQRDTGNKFCNGTTLNPASGEPTWKSSGAKWVLLRNRFGGPELLSWKRNGQGKAGKHTIILSSRTPLPHLAALRIETPAAFPEDWNPPKYKVRDLDSVPAKFRGALKSPGNVDVAAMRKSIEKAKRTRFSGTLLIHACTFDRGNARIYANPDKYANAGPIIGSPGGQSAQTVVEYDIDFPAAGQYTLSTKHASSEARPVEVFLDGKNVGRCANSVTFLSPPRVRPLMTTGDSWESVWDNDNLVTMSVTKGKHTLKLARKGKFPHLEVLRLATPEAFPKGWKQSPRQVRQLDTVPVTDRSVFYPADTVNVDALRLAVSDTIEAYGPRYPEGGKHLKQLAALEKKQCIVAIAPSRRGRGVDASRTWAGEENTPPEERKTEDALKLIRREAMLAHPALKFDKLLFIKRRPLSGHIYEDHHNTGTRGNICLLSPVTADGKVTELVPELKGGMFGRFDLSFDGTKVVFCYKKSKDPQKAGGPKIPLNPFHIYEFQLDPSTGLKVPGSLRQLTFSGEEEAKAITASPYTRASAKQGFHDTDPCYLPNGKILFVSARSRRNVFCFGTTVSSLHLMDADGKNISCISQGPLTEMGPSVMDDGRIIYTRWEYLDKGLGNGQSLWAVRPDGSGVDHVYKNLTMRPSGMLHPRSIPGSRRIVTVGNPHCGRQGGSVILVDNRATRRTTEAMRTITPEIAYPCMYHSTWHMGFFLTPYPFSEKFYLVSHIPGDAARKSKKDKLHYGIYALDKWGNRALLHGDPEISCFEPIPLRPRRKPTSVAPVDIAEAKQQKTGTLFIQDVYEGLTGIERGRVKYVRVMGALEWPWDQNGIFRIGLPGAVHRKRVYGIAKVHEDGSARFQAPAEQNIFFQALDENFMQLQHMPTFINMRPGERRSCIGCHEKRRKAPTSKSGRLMALNHPAEPLSPQPGDSGARMVHYSTDVQAALDKHCIKCHSGDNPKGRLDLSGEPTGEWCRSYNNIVGKGLISSRDCGFGRSQFVPQPPLSYGSHLSRLVAKIRKDPCKGTLTRPEFIRIITWIDANAPYYGTYRGKRAIQHKDEPDFRLPPLTVKY